MELSKLVTCPHCGHSNVADVKIEQIPIPANLEEPSKAVMNVMEDNGTRGSKLRALCKIISDAQLDPPSESPSYVEAEAIVALSILLEDLPLVDNLPCK